MTNSIAAQPKPLLDYSEERIGHVWTQADHDELRRQMARIDELSQELYRRTTERRGAE